MKRLTTTPSSTLLALLVGGAFATSPVVVRAQADQAEATPKATTSTQAEEADDDIDDADLPDPGFVGSRISKIEKQPPSPPTAQEIESAQSLNEQLARLEKELLYYQSGAQSFQNDMKALIRLKYEEQRELLASQYDRAIEELEQQERERRLEAIARFEEFLRKYPNDPVYTPDAMFRLAELYFEKSSDEYLQRSKGYEIELVAFEEGRRETEPAPPEPTFEKTIGLHKDLLARFPEYRLADAARYLLGYCYGEQGQEDEALASFLSLTDNHPNSSFLPEVWTRIGEIYFDGNSTEDLEKAIAAYREVVRFPDSPYYDKALYKIAWTYYRLDRYDEAVASFVDLVNYADEQEKLTGETGSELREEAIQYVAISLSDETWGGLGKAKEVLGKLDNKPYVGEMWKRYGEILFDQTRYDDAIEVLTFTIAKYPTAEGNPEAQEKIVRAYEAQRDFDSATKAREKLVADYSEGSQWHEANKDDPDVLAKAGSLAERSLYTAAIFRHQQAQAYKKNGKPRLARTQYLAAAEAYQGYLGRFPKSKNVYDFQFFLAECLYYSDQYMNAASQYDKVRDSQLDNKHLQAAALSSVISYEKAVEGQIGSGKLVQLPLQTAAERKNKKIAPKPIDPLRKELVNSSDRYATILPKSERAPAIRYRAAEVFYRHDQFDEARKRFQDVVANYPDDEVAQYASNLIIESYLVAEDWENVEKWSKQLIAVAQGASAKDAEAKKKFIESLNTFKVGAQFKQAENYDAAGKYEEAADTYVRLVDDNPNNEFADKALFNAAVAYEKVKRFDTASQIYKRIYDKYPKSELAPRSLFRVGINAEKGFDFSQAISAYTRLVERYPDSENRADALYNKAVVLENMQNYSEAADAFKRYAQTFPNRDDAGEIFFRSALVYEKMKDYPKMIGTLGDFIKRYGRTSKFAESVVQAHEKIAEAQTARGKSRLAAKAYRNCVKEFSKRKLGMRNKAAGYAARCAFELAEGKFRSYDSLQITGTGRKQIKALKAKAEAQRGVERAYQDVFRYKRAETTLAASYRVGHSYERFAESLFSAPIPKEFQKDEELAMEYRAQLEDKAAILERKAEAAYRKAYAEAKRTSVVNEWTQRILEGLNKYSPKEFPIQKSGKAELQTTSVSGFGLDALGTAPKKDAEQPGAARDVPAGAPTAKAGSK